MTKNVAINQRMTTMVVCLVTPWIHLFTASPMIAQVGSSQVLHQEMTCPVCQTAFTVPACPNVDTGGGIDRDLFAHSLGPQSEYYRIATCPKCAYSGYVTDFDENVTIDSAIRDMLLKQPRLPLPAGFGPMSDPFDLDAAIRYDLAIQCYEWRKRSNEALAWLHLRASWIARDEGSNLPRDWRLARVMKYIERYRPYKTTTDNQVDIELQTATNMADAIAAGQFNRYQRPYVELALALILRRHGENHLAMPHLTKLAAGSAFSELLQEGIKRMMKSINHEHKHQAKAIHYFEQAVVANEIQGANRAVVCYMLGELNRRIYRLNEAFKWYDQALRAPDLPLDLRTWIKEADSRTPGQKDGT